MATKTILRLIALPIAIGGTPLISTTETMAQAQAVRLNAYGGYTFADKFNFSGYYGYDQARIDESGHWGGGLEIEIRPRKAIEIYYQSQPTTGRLLGPSLDDYTKDMTVSYLMLGGLGYAGNDKIKGFGGLMLGAAFFNSDGVNSTKFGIGGRLGLLISPNQKIGIRLGAQVLSAVQGAGGGFYFGTGGAGAGVSTYSSLYQFGVFGGLAITLGGGGSARRPTSGYQQPAPAPVQPAPMPGQPTPVPPPPPLPPPR
jgi:hypothetical protein